MSQRPPRDLDWVPDDSTGITVPSQTKQNAGWIVEKPARQFFNWLWNRLSRWTHYFSGQSQEWIVIDSTNANEKDYDTLAAYIADVPSGGDRVLVKETQALTSQMVMPDGITIKILDGILFTRSTIDSASVIKFGNDIIIEGVLDLILSHTGTTAKAIEINGNRNTGNIKVDNASTGIVTDAFAINAGKEGNLINGLSRNFGGGSITNALTDSSSNNSNVVVVRDTTGNIVISTGIVDFVSAQTLTNKTLGTGSKIALGSDADGDIYYRDAGILKRLAKGVNGQILQLISGLPSWTTNPSFSVHRNGTSQNNITGVDKIEWTDEEFDTNNDFDSATNYRFTPTIAGKYMLTTSLQLIAVVVGDNINLSIYKNGVEYKRRFVKANEVFISINLTVIVDANGTTDYFEVFAENANRDTSDMSGSVIHSFFQGSRIS